MTRGCKFTISLSCCGTAEAWPCLEIQKSRQRRSTLMLQIICTPLADFGTVALRHALLYLTRHYESSAPCWSLMLDHHGNVESGV